MALSPFYKTPRDILQLEPGYDFVSEAVLGSHPPSSVEQPDPSFNKRQNDAEQSSDILTLEMSHYGAYLKYLLS